MFRKLLLLATAMFIFASFSNAQGTSTTTTAATTEKPVKAPVFRSTKAQVTEAQTMLKAKNLFSGEATGKSSAEWKTAVKAYQGENGLTKTGSLNRTTLEKMGIALTDKQKTIQVNPNTIASAETTPKKPKTVKTTSTAAATTSTTDGPKRPAPFTAGKDQIVSVQKALKDAKHFSGDATGLRSDELKEAVKKYQEANSLKATGGINAATLEKMGIALTDKQKANVAAQAAYDAAKTPKN